MDNLQLTSLHGKGWHYTFCNKHDIATRVYSKIDWAFSNFQWVQRYNQEKTEFSNTGVSDHTSILIEYQVIVASHPKPFKLFNTMM